MDDGNSLENCQVRKDLVGSNPTPSALSTFPIAMDHDQQSRVLPRSIPLAYVAAGAFGLALIIGGAVYFWWSPTQEMSEEDVLTQRVVALQQEVDAHRPRSVERRST